MGLLAPLTGRSVYRIRVADLNDEKLSSTELSAKVERYSDKPNNGGLSIDYAGNLYLTAVESKSIGVVGHRSQVPHFPDGSGDGLARWNYSRSRRLHVCLCFADFRSSDVPRRQGGEHRYLT